MADRGASTAIQRRASMGTPRLASTGSLSAASTRRAGLDERVLRIETPELVAIEFPLAGPGSRFAALLIDVAVLLSALLGVGLVAVLLQVVGAPQLLAVVLLFVVLPLSLFGYFFAFEALAQGRTPGKRAMGIRTVMQSGAPLTPAAAAVRNVVRIVDVQPGVACIVGGVSMLFDAHARRLGDLAAGSIVVKELPADFPEIPETSSTSARPRLPEEAFEGLERYMDRRAELPAAARRSLATRLAEMLSRSADAPIFDGRGADSYVIAYYSDERARRAGARRSSEVGAAAAVTQLTAKRSRWIELGARFKRLGRRGVSGASEDAVAELAAGLRELSADLARARTYGASPGVVWALERRVGDAHALFYRPAADGLSRAWKFLGAGFPALVRRLWRPIALSSALLYVPALLSFWLLTSDPSLETPIAGEAIVVRADMAASDPSIDYRDTLGDIWIGSDLLSGMVIGNNIRVALIAYAGGILLGVGSAVSMLFNGVHLGSALAVFSNRDVAHNILLFIAPHGAIELTAFAIAGGAGLHLASAILLPGRRRRLGVLSERGRESVALMGGVVAMLLVAGVIEGFVSPARISPALKLLAASAACVALFGYLASAGRARETSSHLA